MADECTGRIPDHDGRPIGGPTEICVACGAKDIWDAPPTERREGDVIKPARAPTRRSSDSGLEPPRACWPASRARISWFRRCKVDGRHLHERCKSCGYEWISTFWVFDPRNQKKDETKVEAAES